MKKFDYREFLAEGYLSKEAKRGSENEARPGSESLDNTLTKFKELSNWEEEMEIFKVKELMIATITFNCDSMACDLDDLSDDDSFSSFSQQYGVSIIPFSYYTDLPYNGDPWDYDLIASGFVLLKSPFPKLFPVQDLNESNNSFLVKLQKYIDKIAVKYSDDGSEEDLYENKNRMKKFDYQEFLAEGYLFKEASESYPKAEAWLQQHPEVKVYTSVSDIADPEGFEDLETDLVEAGYMFISELEAALEGQNYGSESDEDLLASCEKGVINDPNYNPPVSSFNY